MAGMAKASIIGNLGKAPEVRYLANGDPVANFSIAVNEKRDGKESTTWWRVSVFGKLAEVCGQHLDKGRQVYVEGRLQQRTYKDKDGVEKMSTEVVANVVQFLGGGDHKTSGAPKVAGGGEMVSGPVDEELPF